MKMYKIAQAIFRGDPSPISVEDYDAEYGRRELGKDLGSSSSWGPGIYFTGQEDIARMYGSHITKKFLNNARILTKQSPLLYYSQIDHILNGIDEETIKTAISNWDEDYDMGRDALIRSIMNDENVLEQIMNVWSEVFHNQNHNIFIELMVKSGIDGIFLQKGEDETYYVIYNKSVLI